MIFSENIIKIRQHTDQVIKSLITALYDHQFGKSNDEYIDFDVKKHTEALSQVSNQRILSNHLRLARIKHEGCNIPLVQFALAIDEPAVLQLLMDFGCKPLNEPINGNEYYSSIDDLSIYTSVEACSMHCSSPDCLRILLENGADPHNTKGNIPGLFLFPNCETSTRLILDAGVKLDDALKVLTPVKLIADKVYEYHRGWLASKAQLHNALIENIALPAPTCKPRGL